jgi:hypothetical protein
MDIPMFLQAIAGHKPVLVCFVLLFVEDKMPCGQEQWL